MFGGERKNLRRWLRRYFLGTRKAKAIGDLRAKYSKEEEVTNKLKFVFSPNQIRTKPITGLSNWKYPGHVSKNRFCAVMGMTASQK